MEPQNSEKFGAQMSRFRDAFGYPFVLMLRDNIYDGPATAEDYRLKFEAPYHDLLDTGGQVLRRAREP